MRLRRYGGIPVAEAIVGPNISHTDLINIVTRLPRLQTLHLDNVFILHSTGDLTSPEALLPTAHLRLQKLLMSSCSGRVGPMAVLALPTLFDSLTIFPADVVDLSWLTIACDSGEVTFDGIQLPPATYQPNQTLNVRSLILDKISNRGWSLSDTTRLYSMSRQALAPRCLTSFQAQRRKDLHVVQPKPTFDKRNPHALRVLGELLEHAGGDALLHLSLPFSIEGESPEDRPGKCWH